MKPVVYKDFCTPEGTFECGNFSKRCEECDKEFNSVGVYEVHVNKVHKLDPMDNCDGCGTNFKRRMGLILHFRQTHMAVTDPTYGKAIGCDICDAFLIINGFGSYADLVDHTHKVHGPDTFINKVGNTGRSKCPICPGCFTYRKGMIEHLQVIHGEHLIEKMLLFTGKDKERFQEERRFKCRHCKRLFTVRKSLISHLEKVHEDFDGFSYGTATVNSEKEALAYKSYRSSPGGGETPSPGVKRPASDRIKTPISKYLNNFKADIAQNPGIQPCPHCRQVFPRKSILDLHVRMTHKKQDENPVKVEVKEETILESDLEVKENSQALYNPPREPSPPPAPPAKKRKQSHSNLLKELEEEVERSYEAMKKSRGFYTPEELKKCEAEKHEDFYDNTVSCEANADPDDEREACIEPGCSRKFINYFSMMRHVAFFHRPEKTAKLMKVKVFNRSTVVKVK